MENIYELVVSWFEENGRNFPWRNTKDPYKILIAEIMLQKTSASQVLRVYENFIEKYPDPESLSRANKKTIKDMIEPLGLQERRSKHLKELGVTLKSKENSKVPDKEEGYPPNTTRLENQLYASISCIIVLNDTPQIPSHSHT